MSVSLKERMLAARQQWVEAGGFKFEIRRPTAMQLMRFREGGDEEMSHRVMTQCVVGWNLRESDLLPGGGSDLVAFDSEAFVAWVEDRPELWAPLTAAIFDMIAAHRRKYAPEDGAKN